MAAACINLFFSPFVLLSKASHCNSQYWITYLQRRESSIVVGVHVNSNMYQKATKNSLRISSISKDFLHLHIHNIHVGIGFKIWICHSYVDAGPCYLFETKMEPGMRLVLMRTPAIREWVRASLSILLVQEGNLYI